MNSNPRLSAAVRLAMGVTSGFVVLGSGNALAQDDEAALEEVVVTGTRITVPGIESSSPIYSVGSDEIDLQAQPEVERILRLLPITKPDDGQNVNNGTDGAATVDLRGLGEERNLVLVDGRRVTPYSTEGLVDLQTIPTALIERIDIITGGASAVYGSDAIAGALNFVMKKDFEGVDFRYNHSEYSEGDGQTQNASLTLGANSADGRGNAVLNVEWADRTGVLFADRPLGTLGIGTDDGSNYQEFLNGDVPAPPPAGCQAPFAAASGGSTTTIPTRVAIGGGPGLGQMRDDRTLSDNCSVFNFNPFNYYQTPQQRWGGMAMARFEINEHAEVYGSYRQSSVNVRQQVGPSGIFGNTFFTPLSNPFIGDQARTTILSAANTGAAAGTVCADPTCGGTNNDPEAPSFVNWVDVNGDGVVDAGDELNIQYRRRTLEFGPRSTGYDSNLFQMTAGVRGDIMGDWTYDLFWSRGESDRSSLSAGYTNVDAISNAVRGVAGPQGGVVCDNGDPACVPIDFWGGFGTITPEMAAANSASAINNENYKQTVISASVSGPINVLQLPTADSPVAVSLGAETREEVGSQTPDECWKLAPASCLGGAGGNLLPIGARYDVDEFFFEAYVPLLQGMTFFEDLSLELGARTSDYSHVGSNETWKAGLSWRPVDSLLFRVMAQEATRAPNIAEIGSPVVSGLEDALLDPCSVANAGNIDAALQALCISTGMSAAQVGQVEDIVSGQINNFGGTNPNALPGPETADTITAGFVWTPEFNAIPDLVVSLDYYEVDIEDTIGELTSQEILDGCYIAGLDENCALITRVGGTLTIDGSGTNAFTQNLEYLIAEGIELNLSASFELPGRWGSLDVSANINHYMTQESRSTPATAIVECVGKYGNSCGNPLPENRWIQRTSWYFADDFMISYLWSHLDSVNIEDPQVAGTFEQFRSIGSYDYFDLTGTWQATEQIGVTVAILNVFDEEPPVLGNEAGTTASNSGNTFPSMYNTLGTMYTAGFRVQF
ncbi:MAG: TonB-dependent receptor [Gammaproteobacteria bacterium]|jgi:outer membrane receptor protein involved in Fe transport|nr:TonB-dependent receptor [Gammaproteobacteria bacterium]